MQTEKSYSDIHIRTTLITGFPGEGEEDFDELVDFVESQKFERLGVFAYSGRKVLLPEIWKTRSMKRSSRRADSIMRRQMDTKSTKKKWDAFSRWTDRMKNAGYDAPEIDNTVIFQAEQELVPGDLVTITDAFDYDIVGRMEE